MIIIGITGTLGAGKGTIVDYLVREKGFLHFSVRDFIVEEIIRRGLSVNRDTMTEVGNDLRKLRGPSFIAEELYKQAAAIGKSCVIESLRTEGEISALRRRANFYLFAIDAKTEKRYERISQRRSETDHITYEQFLSDEAREFSTLDPTKQNLSRCIELADYVFNNDGTVQDLHEQINRVLEKIMPH